MNKKIIIIGAGIGGLSTGCYARMNGYETVIFEERGKPGGSCTSWKRDEFTFDYCIQHLAGTGQRSNLRQLWNELGALSGTEIIHNEVFIQVEDHRGQRLNLFADLDRLESHLKRLSPLDADLIKAYLDTVRSLRRTDLLSIEMGGAKRKLQMLRHLHRLVKWSRVTMEDYAARFRDPFLSRAFSRLHYNLFEHKIPLIANAVFLAALSNGDLGFPAGGSLAFSRRIEKRFLALGGQIVYRSPVVKVLLRDNQAVGVRLADGSEHHADVIISAADGHATIYRLLEGRYTSPLIRDYYRACDRKHPYGIQVHLGLDHEISSEPLSLALMLESPLRVDIGKRRSLFVRLFPSKMGLSPAGTSVLKVVTVGDQQYWKEQHSDSERYAYEKERVYETIVDCLERRFSGLRRHIVVHDVITPVSAERRTGNFRGSQPWLPLKLANTILRRGVSKTLPGLDRFHMVGQWAAGIIGLPLVALMGRNLIEQLCKTDHKRFHTSIFW